LEFFRQRTPVKGWKVTSFDVELLFLAEKFGYKIKEIPVEWKDRDVSTGKKKSYIKESLEMLRQILRVKINDLQGMYSQ
jgi:dolichyl-phosphate beta-glucosyltransferase